MRHMFTRPTGTVTFLFTDIEGSTALWERYPDSMRSAFHRHERIIRDAVAIHNGYAYKMIGDAFQIAFASAPDALAAAVDIQRALQSQVWEVLDGIRVRMAIHTGVTEERSDDYVGPALNRAARLMGAGHGGQILISSSAAELLRDQLPPDVSLRDLGALPLKD